MAKKVIIATVLIIVTTALARQYMVGNYIKLDSAPALAGTVSQSMYGGKSNTEIPVAGKDFELAGVNYFDNGNWVVASISPIGNKFDRGAVILQKQNGIYVTVLGPGSDFDISFLQSMPKDVGDYLTTLGVINGPTN